MYWNDPLSEETGSWHGADRTEVAFWFPQYLPLYDELLMKLVVTDLESEFHLLNEQATRSEVLQKTEVG